MISVLFPGDSSGAESWGFGVLEGFLDFFNTLLEEAILNISSASFQFCWMLAEASKLCSINQRGKSW